MDELPRSKSSAAYREYGLELGVGSANNARLGRRREANFLLAPSHPRATVRREWAGLRGGSVHPTLCTHHLDLKHEGLRGEPLARSHGQLWTGSQATPQSHATSRVGPLEAKRPQHVPLGARQNRSVALTSTEPLGLSIITAKGTHDGGNLPYA